MPNGTALNRTIRNLKGSFMPIKNTLPAAVTPSEASQINDCADFNRLFELVEHINASLKKNFRTGEVVRIDEEEPNYKIANAMMNHFRQAGWTVAYKSDQREGSWYEFTAGGDSDLLNLSPVTKPEVVTSKMVDRFLSWPLPKSVRPDPCVSMPEYPHRIGTNLLNANEAEEMLRYVLEG